MTNMDDMDAMLAAYADGELDEAGTARVEALLAGNPAAPETLAAQETLAVQRETTALLRAAFAESLFAKPAAALPPPARGRAAMSRPNKAWYGWAIAASILMGMVGYGAGASWPNLIQSERDRMLTDVADYHAVYSRETVHLVEVPAAQADHLKAWLGKRVNRTLVIPNFEAAGLTFAGGRMVVMDGLPVAELMYTRDGGLPIAFCVFHRTGKPGDVQEARRGAMNLATWEDGSNSFVVVGEATPNTIRELAALARKQI